MDKANSFLSYLSNLERSSSYNTSGLKIAICLSGHFRLYREIYLNFHKYLYLPCFRQGLTDIFISSWDELNTSSSFSAKNKEVSSSCGTFDRGDILEKYPAQDYIFENFESKMDEFHVHRHDPLIDLSVLNPSIHENGVLFGLAQFYRRFQCNEMKRKREISTGKRYDMVILMRPDVFFLREFDPASIDLSKLYSRTLYTDTLLISSSENMDKITSLHLQAGRIMRQYKTQKPLWFDPYCPEYFYEHFFPEIGFNDTNRGELGEDFMWYYPRKSFLPTIAYILNKFGRLDQIHTILNHPFTQAR